ncbi:MAG: MOSC domain-containing protein [Saprospiraceae bacterium]|nr:MOSC domain-containing protein [Saprospiraceae bacterium]MCF8250712.1 MOSC domain-containing protein [Saprospiraceae bacterium]MCF8279768.1 MOSC domain-containing protein [Bacteroidales bacterium]MCF8310526.1 MOSC domain-containing protein [Saprospiraceae bacterium]MCF8440842.1 MOSC domain-containing protein [Saprospiraceae bacterium]
MSYIKELMRSIPQVGKVEWVSVRPTARGEVMPLEAVEAQEGKGLVGDHYSGASGTRQVTLIQAEHLAAVAYILKMDVIDPELTRRNIVVSGINLLAFADQQFQIGEAVLEMTGLCHPCTRMEENLGAGGYNAMRGHGGITCRIVKGGKIKVGDAVRLN